MQNVEIDAWTAVGRWRTPIRFVYSVEAPHIELIEAKAGTLWTAVGDLGFHHLGFWVDDLAREAARLEELGLVRELAGASDEDLDPHFVTYHRHQTGLRIELVDQMLMPSMEKLWGQT